MKEVILYSPGAYQAYGHSFDYSKGLSEAFYNLGYTVHVFGIDGPLQFPEFVNEKRTRKNTNPQKKKTLFEKLRWGFKRLFDSNRILNDFTKFYGNFENRPLVIFETFEYFSLAKTVAPFSNNYFCVFHDTNFNFQHTSLIAGLYKQFAKIPAKKIVKNSIRSFVHGAEMKKNFIHQMGAKYAQKIEEIPYGAPNPLQITSSEKVLSREKIQLEKDKKYLLSFGTLRSDKEYEPILSALKSKTDWVWIIAGPEGDYSYNDILEKGKKEKVEERILTFPKFIKNDEQRLFFTAADVVINLYKPFIRHESGTAQLARTYNVPVIVSGPPDLTEYVSKKNIGWVVNEKLSVAKVLGTFESLDQKEKTIILDNIRTLALKNSWSSVVNRILSFT
ncbi:glycosyltransferase [Flagellimonas eckloniae]|uniref:Glycosyl transferase family 1 domain-containing protein n=1 Tax=Flagellimonas eckloniae TaxID=346185 RepID=A0A0Q1CF08_9FLAO|nr:glycosyltransferase [Allomuricauda eckloniae]KQC29332.1 hypothetical protein AAY42_05000 [Allomuricauda eckloniae]